MYKICNVQQLGNIEKLPEEVVQAVTEAVTILEAAYGS